MPVCVSVHMHEYMQGAHACAYTQKSEEVVGCLYHPIPLRQDLSLGLTFSHLEEKLGSPSNPCVSACLRAELIATCGNNQLGVWV